jgi:phosphatidylglycerophosphate synthase
VETDEQNTTKARARAKLRTNRLVLNAALFVLAVFLAIAYLEELFLVAYFAIASAAIALVVSWARLRQVTKTTSAEPIARHRKLTIFLLILVLSSPFLLFLLARFLEPTLWFVILASAAAGAGMSEIILYAYCRTLVKRND